MFDREGAGRARARLLLAKTGHAPVGGHFKAGGHPDERADVAMLRKAFKEHDQQLHGGKKTTLKFADGGTALGDMAAPRMDQRARGKGMMGKGKGKGGPKTQINIIAPGKSAAAAEPDADDKPPMMPPPKPPMPPGAGGPPPGPPPGAGPMAGPPPGLMGPPPGGPPGGPPGMPPGMPMRRPPMPGGPPMKSGGRARRAYGGALGMPGAVPPQAMGAPGMGAPGLAARPPMGNPGMGMPPMGGPPPAMGGGMPVGGPTPGLPPQAAPMANPPGMMHAGGRAGYAKGGKTKVAPGAEYQPPGQRGNVTPDQTPDNVLERAIRADASDKQERGDQMPQQKRGGRAAQIAKEAKAEGESYAHEAAEQGEKSGGRAHKADGGQVQKIANELNSRSPDYRRAMENARSNKAGGFGVGKGTTSMHAGAGSGQGRLEKAHISVSGRGR